MVDAAGLSGFLQLNSRDILDSQNVSLCVLLLIKISPSFYRIMNFISETVYS